MANVDIIIPYYNAEKTIDRCLSSVAMQTYLPQITVTLVDDCSETPPADVVNRWKPLMNIQYIRLDENRGPGVARQEGLDETDGDFVVFCDADDTLVSSFAVQKLVEAITKDNLDMVSTAFNEEADDSTFLKHRPNYVWVFAKIYRRSFLERHLIRFPDSRANEDVGFNCVVKALTDRVKEIDFVTYEWHWSPNTITRKDNADYGYGVGHEGYAENMAWVVEELRRRGVNKEIIREQAVSVLCKLYFMDEDIEATKPDRQKMVEEVAKKYYDSAVKPIVLEGALQFAYIAEQYRIQAERMLVGRQLAVINKKTFRDFLKMLGYYEDLKLTMGD